MPSLVAARYEPVVDQEPNCDIELDLLDKQLTRKLLSQACFWASFKTTLLIALYFVPSIGLTFYQRWLLKDFHYPLSVVLVHLFVKFTLAVILRECWGAIKRHPRKILPWRQFVRGVAPTGIASGLDVGLSNWGLEFVTVSLYAMTKSTTIIFILICSIAFKLEKKSWSLATIVTMISIGLLMFTYKSTQFNMLGFCLLLLASLMSGLRWSCAQLLMQRTNCISNPIDMIYHVQPWMIVSLLPVAIACEGQSFVTSCLLFRYKDVSVLYLTLTKVFIGAIIAFLMEITEFLVVNHTSSLTLSMAGIFKEIVVVALAVVWNGDVISGINLLGLLLCLCGIFTHITHKLNTQSSKMFSRNDNFRMRSSSNDLLKKPLMNEDSISNISESDAGGDESDSQIIFNILNSRDR